MSIITLTDRLGSCVCLPEEVAEATAQGFKEIYIRASNGIFKRQIFRGEGRYIQTKVDKVDSKTYTQENFDLKEDLTNFLPAGKIPYHMWEKVIAFFRKVSEVKKAELEAMIHILWNQEQGYHFGVPPQTISKASVSYDWGYIPAGTSVIVDIHSH